MPKIETANNEDNIMSDTIETQEIERDGRSYLVEYSVDFNFDAPWNCQELVGNIDVKENYMHKSPGQRIIKGLYTDYLYDFQDAVAKAKKQWVIPEEGETLGQAAVKLVEKEVKWLDGYINDQWTYICVTVFDVTEEKCKHCAPSDSLSGIEFHYNTDDEYITGIVKEMIENVEYERLNKPIAA